MHRRSALSLLLLLAACGETAAPSEATPSSSKMGVVGVRPQSAPLDFQYGGRVTAVRQTEVRARAGGILLGRAYTEGAQVREGDVLFRTDPATYQAAVDPASAQLQEADANVQRARRDQRRTAELLRADAGSHKDRDAASALAQAEAVMAAARARLELGHVSGAARDTIRIPQAAVQQDVQGSFAYVVGPDAKAEHRTIRLGRAVGREWV